jgi:hypothetical protein
MKNIIQLFCSTDYTVFIINVVIDVKWILWKVLVLVNIHLHQFNFTWELHICLSSEGVLLISCLSLIFWAHNHSHLSWTFWTLYKSLDCDKWYISLDSVPTVLLRALVQSASSFWVHDLVIFTLTHSLFPWLQKIRANWFHICLVWCICVLEIAFSGTLNLMNHMAHWAFSLLDTVILPVLGIQFYCHLNTHAEVRKMNSMSFWTYWHKPNWPSVLNENTFH